MSPSEPGPQGPPGHHRSLPLPLRVKTGRLHEEALLMETAQDAFRIPWGEVSLFALGLIQEKVETETAAYNMERMMQGVSKMLKGGARRGEGSITSHRETCLLDLYVRDRPDPFRFDSAHVNYRALLGEVSYVSFQNFYRLVHQLACRCTAARFTPTAQVFLSRRRDKPPRFGAAYDFELDSLQRLQGLSDQLTWDQLELDRTSWAEEWSDPG